MTKNVNEIIILSINPKLFIGVLKSPNLNNSIIPVIDLNNIIFYPEELFDY